MLFYGSRRQVRHWTFFSKAFSERRATLRTGDGGWMCFGFLTTPPPGHEPNHPIFCFFFSYFFNFLGARVPSRRTFRTPHAEWLNFFPFFAEYVFFVFSFFLTRYGVSCRPIAFSFLYDAAQLRPLLRYSPPLLFVASD